MGDYGIKIAKPGVNVESATIQQQYFNSNYALFKVLFSGTLTLTMTASPGNDGMGNPIPSKQRVTFSHNLGYIPAFRCYAALDSGGTKRQSLDIETNFGLTYTTFILARMLSDRLEVRGVNPNNVSITRDIYYYIYADVGA